MTGLGTVLLRDVWAPVWPNLVASVLWTVPVIVWHHRRIRDHITKTIAEQAGRDAP